MQQKRWIAVSVLVAVIGLAAGCTLLPGGAATPTPAPVIRDDYVPTINVTGEIVPAVWAPLSLPVGGLVIELPAVEGQPVAAGDLLVKLEDAAQQAALAQALARQSAAEAAVAELQAGPRPQAVAAAEAAVQAAQAQLDRLLEGPRAEDIAVADAAVAVAEASLQQLLEGAGEAELAAARAEWRNAQAALRQAQAAYDRVSWRDDVAVLPQALQLEQATNAEQAAQARYQALADGASDGEIARAEALVRQAEAERDRAKATASDSQIDAARAQVAQAQAQLELTQAGARPETVAAAQAEVDAASAAVTQAQVALGQTELMAPYDGVVAVVHARVGERVTLGEPLAEIADLSGLRVETTDLNEIDVARIKVGDRATVTYDALPDVMTTGTVTQIATKVAPGSGVNYTVIIELDALPKGIRWGMTAFVDIEVSA